MARYVPRTYKNGRARRIFLRVILVILAALLVALVAAFFYMRRYIVYTPDGLRLEVPWLTVVSQIMN